MQCFSFCHIEFQPVKITFLEKYSVLYIYIMYIAFYILLDGFLGPLFDLRASTCSLSPVLVIISNSEWGYEWRWWGARACLVDRLNNTKHFCISKKEFHLGLSAKESYSVTKPAEGEQNIAFHFLQVSPGCTVCTFYPGFNRVLGNGKENIILSCTFGETENASTTEVLFNLLANRLLNHLPWMIV